MEKEQAEGLDGWALVELFGHQQIAGKVTSQAVGVACLIRVDVPEIELASANGAVRLAAPGDQATHTKPALTRFFGVGAIYSITPLTEAACRAACVRISPAPYIPLDLPARRALPEGEEDY
jgi:hypothetical protein